MRPFPRTRELRQRISEDLLHRYEDIKKVRGGVAVAEALDETCLACNFTLRPQLYVEVRNVEEVLSCENCRRILFSRQTLEIPESVLAHEADDDLDAAQPD